MLRVAWSGTYVQTQHDDREMTIQRGEIDLVHDQDLGVGEARLAVDYGVTRRFGASLVVPVRFVSSSIRYLAKADGADVDLAMPGIHHRDENLVGIADPMLLGSFTAPVGPVRVVLRGGLTVPLGSTEDNPFTPEAETTPHQHVQMGSGTFRPVLAADVSYPRGRWRFGGFAFTQQSLYDNDRGYKTGDRYAAGLAVSRTTGKKWSLRGGAEIQAETAERWDGVIPTDDGNRGRFDAMVTAGATYAATDRLAIDATIKIPFVTEAVGGQLDMPAILEVGAAWRFGAAAKKPAHDDHDHEHGHDHEHEHEHGDTHVDGDEHGDAHADGDEHGDAAGGEHVHPDAHGGANGAGGGAKDGGATSTGVTSSGGTATGGGAKDGGATSPGTSGSGGAKPAAKGGGTTSTAGTSSAASGTSSGGGAKHGGGTAKPAAKPDVAAYNKPGEAPDLVPVKGKVTIFDFWATWCEPCKKLDPALVELAKKYPDLVAVRKLDVVDWDSKAAERYLTPGGFDLPHLKIYDARGARVLEQSSAPGKLQALIDAARAIVEAAAKQRGPR